MIMFGYVTPLTDELKVKEYAFYKSVYCGLCRTMKKRVCDASRLTLSYDMVFLALLRMGLTDEVPTLRTVRCGLSPYKKRVIALPCEALTYCSAAGALLAYYNICDKAEDSRGLRRCFFRLLRALAGGMKRKAALTALDERVREELSALSALEKSGDPSPDGLAECFGRLLRAVFAEGLPSPADRIAGEIGFHLGKWIWFIDAVDDHEKDKKRGEFNPFGEIDAGRMRCTLDYEITGMASALALVTFSDAGIGSIVNNIVYSGLPAVGRRVLDKASGAGKDSDRYSQKKDEERQA